MNKKLLAVFAVITLSLPAAAQGALQLPPHWQDALKQKVNYATFDHALHVLGKPLTLTIPVTKQYFFKDGAESEIPSHQTALYRQLEGIETYPSTTGCKAYALDENWVIAGATCLWNGRHDIDFTPTSPTAIFATGLVEPNPAKKYLEINGYPIPWEENLFIQPRESQNPHIILVRVPSATPFGHRLQTLPKINIWAFKNTTPADLLGGDFYINTARFGLNTVRKRMLANQGNSTVTLQDHTGDLAGLSTDPLMYIQRGQLHWVGVNQGVTKLRYGNLAGDWDGQASTEYFYFTPDDIDFIKQTLSRHDPNALQRIEQRKGLEIL